MGNFYLVANVQYEKRSGLSCKFYGVDYQGVFHSYSASSSSTSGYVNYRFAVGTLIFLYCTEKPSSIIGLTDVTESVSPYINTSKANQVYIINDEVHYGRILAKIIWE